ncbi:MAG TPA: hypothetical protein VFV32_11325 [Acidimicrobiales bacterium]|nr:hypothetical protein [Acidimicrobiales bacterium]
MRPPPPARRLLLVLLLSAAALLGCSSGPDRAADTADEARRDRIAAARAASPIGMVGDGELGLVDAFLQQRAAWDEAYDAAFTELTSTAPDAAGDLAPHVTAALDDLHGVATALAALPTDGVDAAVAGWFASITAGYRDQAAAVGALAIATGEGRPTDDAFAEVTATYEATVTVELRLLREVAEWINEDGPVARARLDGIADAIERETEARP